MARDPKNSGSPRTWRNTWAYRKATRLAKSVASSPKKLLALLEKASKKSEREATGTIGKTLESLKVMIRLLTAYAKGEYRDVALENVALIITAIVYFVMPLDALPDFIAVLGLTDDAALLTWTWSKVRAEVERYLEWELEHESLADDSPPVLNELEFKE